MADGTAMAKEYLLRLHEMRNGCKYLKMEIDRLREDMETVSSVNLTAPNVQTSKGCGARFADRFSRLEELERLHDERWLAYMDMRDRINSQIESMQCNDNLKRVLYLRYVVGISAEEIAGSIGYDVRHVFRLTRQALQVFAETYPETAAE